MVVVLKATLKMECQLMVFLSTKIMILIKVHWEIVGLKALENGQIHKEFFKVILKMLNSWMEQSIFEMVVNTVDLCKMVKSMVQHLNISFQMGISSWVNLKMINSLKESMRIKVDKDIKVTLKMERWAVKENYLYSIN